MPETTVLKVLLHCDGCVSKVKRHIRRLEGVESFHVDQKNSKVTVYGTVKPQVVLDKVLRAGKTAEFWPEPVVVKEAATKEPEVVGGKKKAADGGENGSAKKQKSGKKDSKESIELEEFDAGDGEIVNEHDVPALEVADESEERGLMDKRPAKKGGNKRG
ncbi:hypothetical protein KC19_9G188900 [Ceratodon purpureus]|uniref:HMA domain-containing protein n=1 Tax=Ceratodon purpureus TaxID=3225 RepID=A0A8T0GVS2_CERPU|nr:hypothetical protein KC19_9G188900 [Ceratodon purpureus]